MSIENAPEKVANRPAEQKLQNPSPNIQRTSKRQTTSKKFGESFRWSFEFGISLELGCWSLDVYSFAHETHRYFLRFEQGHSPGLHRGGGAARRVACARKIELVYGGGCVGLMGVVVDAALRRGGHSSLTTACRRFTPKRGLQGKSRSPKAKGKPSFL